MNSWVFYACVTLLRLNGGKHLADRGFLSWVYKRIVVPLEMRSIACRSS